MIEVAVVAVAVVVAAAAAAEPRRELHTMGARQLALDVSPAHSRREWSRAYDGRTSRPRR